MMDSCEFQAILDSYEKITIVSKTTVFFALSKKQETQILSTYNLQTAQNSYIFIFEVKTEVDI